MNELEHLLCYGLKMPQCFGIRLRDKKLVEALLLHPLTTGCSRHTLDCVVSELIRTGHQINVFGTKRLRSKHNELSRADRHGRIRRQKVHKCCLAVFKTWRDPGE